ncbi:MlaD family protein [Nocardioides dubius]|uniref:MlaD family protein n=1 Tax=Nocardioides dubius TaxID=317019 RepID=A0ABN1TR66_9ACTN
MITRRTRIQLTVFALITVLGVAFVGARYARLDRLFLDTSYTVVAHFPDSGGIFAGAGVTYRGTTIGRVGELKLTDEGVDVHLEIDNKWDEIPADTIAQVANRSAVGEQYVDLQPNVSDGPYLRDDSQIAEPNTRIPIPAAKLIADVATTAGSVDRDALRTVIEELGLAFDGTGEDLAQIIDTSNSFIETADANFDLTTSLIRDSNKVLGTQLDLAQSIKSFATNLDLFTTTLAGSDKDLRTVIDSGSEAANTLRRFIEENDIDLTSLLNNLRTTSEVVVKRLDGVEHLLAIYPYVVEAGMTVVSKDPETGLMDAHFGLILTPHQLCHKGYEGTDQRNPANGEWRDLNTDARCTDPNATPRGAHAAPNRAPASYRAPVVATLDDDELVWAPGVNGAKKAASTGSVSTSRGTATWEWLLLRSNGGSEAKSVG